MKNKRKRDYDEKKIPWTEAWALNKRALLLWLSEYPKLFVVTGFHALAAALVPYLTLYFSARLLDELAGERRPELLTKWVIVLLAGDAAACLLKALLFRWRQALAANLYYRGEVRILRKLLSMDFAAADDASTQELLDRVRQREIWMDCGLGKVYWQFASLTEELFRMVGAAALTASLFLLPVPDQAGWLTLLNHPACMLVMALVMIGVILLSPYLATLGERRVLAHGEEMMFGNRSYFFRIDLFREEKRALDMRIYRQDIFGVEEYRKLTDPKTGFISGLGRDARGRMGALFAMSEAVSRSFLGVAYLFVCLKAFGGAFGVGAVTRYIGGIMAFSTGLSGILKVLGEAAVNSEALKITFEFLDIPNEMYQGSLTVEKRSDRRYEVEFRNVSFKYPHTENYALKNISLKFRVGERLAVVGENGCGKTTFIKLLCRLYDPTEGMILLNGIDIRKYNYREYLSVFSVVFQDFQLLSVSLGENVAAGSRDGTGTPLPAGRRSGCAGKEDGYDRERALACVRMAGLSQWLDARSEGLDTILYRDLDEKGVKISGGEAQKVAIARSLYHNAPFIILDEPTAALDPEAEYEIYTRFNEIVGDRTAIYISHRLSSCRFCDEILVFGAGEILQRGSHEELLRDGEGMYSKLWNAQAQYYRKG